MILQEIDCNEDDVEIKSESENEESAGSENENEDEESAHETGDDDSGVESQNLGWADSVAKILRTNKPKGKKTLVLSKAKKLTDVRREKPKPIDFEIEGEIKEEKPDPLSLLDKIKEEHDGEPVKKKRKELIRVRVKPNILDKDREKTLAKIATRGVVQLFNAVREQQKDIQNKLDNAGPLERNKEKVLKSVDKRQFLNVLMGSNAKSQAVDEPVKSESSNEESEHTSESETETASTASKKQSGKKKLKCGATWGVLREDFMMGAKFKDWDKQDDEADED